MLDELGHIAVGEQVPGLVDQDHLLHGSLAQVHRLLHLVDQLQQDDLLEVLAALELFEFQHDQGRVEGDGVGPGEETSVLPLAGEREELATDIL